MEIVCSHCGKPLSDVTRISDTAERRACTNAECVMGGAPPAVDSLLLKELVRAEVAKQLEAVVRALRSARVYGG